MKEGNQGTPGRTSEKKKLKTLINIKS